MKSSQSILREIDALIALAASTPGADIANEIDCLCDRYGAKIVIAALMVPRAVKIVNEIERMKA